MDRKSREELLKKVILVVIVLIIYITAFLNPTMAEVNNQKKALKNNKEDIVELKSLLEEYSKYQGEETQQIEGSLASIVEQEAQNTGITIAYIRPFGEEGDGVEIKVDEMTGEQVLNFVNNIENKGVRVTSLNMRDYKGTGVWVVKMNLKAGGESE